MLASSLGWAEGNIRKPDSTAKAEILFHQVNAPARTIALAMRKLNIMIEKLLEYPPYSPDLGSSDFHQFYDLITILMGKHYGVVIDAYFTRSSRIIFVEKPGTKCIQVKAE